MLTIGPEKGDTMIDLGEPSPSRVNYTCSVGMYRGVIEVLQETDP